MMKTMEERTKLALKRAQQIVKQHADQYSASNAIFGPDAMLAELFTTKEERTQLIKTGVVQQIHDLLDTLPVPKPKRAGRKPAAEPNGKILVRVPKSVHAALLAESEREGISLNQLILSKIMLQLAATI